ncbi:hypothetical protein [Amycolatopsis sp. NPDC004079]|uniref:hypothetical protein n=1 Tax=Amycolatopsis sp. NPDC004079 TaxID=3154549 RepID=UPI0033A65FFE
MRRAERVPGLAARAADRAVRAGGFAGTALYLPNVQEVCAAEGGQVVTVPEPLHTYRRSGTDPDRMRELGFRTDDEDDLAGVALDASVLEGSWRGGLMRFDERGATISLPSD